MKVDAYLIKCLTNMHVGVGGTNYDIVDNIVQRDVTTQMPTIFSSSLKGALREFFKNQWGEDDPKLNYIFGPDAERNKNNEGNIGHFNFFAADLLSLPVPAKDKIFQHTTSDFLLTHIDNIAMHFNSKKEGKAGSEESKKSKIRQNALEKVGEDVKTVDEKTMKRLAKKLPVIARNKLDNGQSKNLFYEEVVPRETHFVFFVAKNDNSKNEYGKAFDNALENNVVQIGANGSIGYGFCEISKIS